MLEIGFVEKLKKFFEKKSIFQLVYLFGSRSINRQGESSDYDFAVLPVKTLSMEERFSLIHELTIHLGATVDLILLDEAPIELKYNIISTGKILYKKDDFYKVEFEAKTLSQYFDYLPVLHYFKKELLKGGKNDAGIQRNRKSFRKTEELFEQIGASKR